MAQVLKTSFAKGIIGPAAYARVDLDLYSAGVKDARNCVVRPHGGLYSRQGIRFIAPVKDHSYSPRLIPFQFKTTDTYQIEFGDEYVRFIRNQASVAEAAKTITGVTQANPGVVTAVAHGYSDGDEVALDEIGGMTRLNGRRFIVAGATTDTFELTDQVTGADVDTTGYSAYTSGGTAERIYTLASPYAIEDVDLIKYVQNKDVLSLVHPNYPIYELTRSGHTNWSFSIPAFKPDIDAPTNLAITPNTTGAVTYQYQVTAVKQTTLEESLPGLDTAGQKSLFSATQANPVVITTTTAHGFSNGDEVALNVTGGLLALDDVRGTISSVTSTTFEMAIDTTGYTLSPIDTSYSNPGGSGNRTATISVSQTAGGAPNGGAVGTGLFDGDTATNIVSWSIANATGMRLRFDFGASASNYTDEIKLYALAAIGGGWTWWGSNDAVSFTQLSSVATVNTANFTFALDLAVPTQGWRYLELRNSGSAPTAAAQGWREFEFKLRSPGTTTGTVARTFKKIINGNATANNTITWTGVTGASGYNVYKLDNGVYGFIGTTQALTFTDDNIAADATDTPPQAQNPFAGENNPGAVGYFLQRRVFGGSNDNPETSYYSQTGNPSNMSVSAPRKDDDAITATLVAQSVNDIRHYVAMTDLIIFTGAAEWRVNSGPDSGFTAETIKQKPQTNWGSSHLRPLLIGSVTIFVEPNGSRVRSMNYDFPNDVYNSSELSILSYHLLEGYNLTDWTFAYSQDQRMHAVRNDGKMICMTFQRDQEVVGWTYWDTKGKFERASALRTIASGVADEIYMVVKRRVNGQTVRYIEVQQAQAVTDVKDAFYVDSGASYDNPVAITNVSLVSTTITVTAVGHGFSNGDPVDLSGIVWEADMDDFGTETQPEVLNDSRFTISNATADTFDIDGTAFASDFPEYVEGGYARKAGNSFTGFDHLEGRTDVVALADGNVFQNLTVTEGRITLPDSRKASRVHAGLPYIATVELLNINAPQTQMQGRPVSAAAINVMVENSRGFVAGVPPADYAMKGSPRYSEAKWRVDEDMDKPTQLFTGVKRMPLENAWNTNGRFFFQQQYPLPMNILYVSPEVDVGDL